MGDLAESAAVAKLRQELEVAGGQMSMGSLSIKVKWGQRDLAQFGNCRTFLDKHADVFQFRGNTVVLAGGAGAGEPPQDTSEPWDSQDPFAEPLANRASARGSAARSATVAKAKAGVNGAEGSGSASVESIEAKAVQKLRKELEEKGGRTSMASLSIKVRWGQGDLEHLGNFRSFLLKHPEVFSIDSSFVCLLGFVREPTPQEAAAAGKAKSAGPSPAKSAGPTPSAQASPGASKAKSAGPTPSAPASPGASKALPVPHRAVPPAPPAPPAPSSARSQAEASRRPPPQDTPASKAAAGSAAPAADTARAATSKGMGGAPSSTSVPKKPSAMGLSPAFAAALAAAAAEGKPVKKAPSAADASAPAPAQGETVTFERLVAKGRSSAPARDAKAPWRQKKGAQDAEAASAVPKSGSGAESQAVDQEAQQEVELKSGVFAAAFPKQAQGSQPKGGLTDAAEPKARGKFGAKESQAAAKANRVPPPPKSSLGAQSQAQQSFEVAQPKQAHGIGAREMPAGMQPYVNAADTTPLLRPAASQGGKGKDRALDATQAQSKAGASALAPTTGAAATTPMQHEAPKRKAWQMAGLSDAELQALAKKTVPSDDYCRACQKVMMMLKASVKQITANVDPAMVQINICGSHEQGNHLDGSDMDVFLRLPPSFSEAERDAYADALREELKSAPHYSKELVVVQDSLRTHWHTSAPMSVQSTNTSPTVVTHVLLPDSRFNFSGPTSLDGIIGRLSRTCDQSNVLVRLVKLWATNHGFTSLHEGYMSGVGWALLVIFFLQNEKLVPASADLLSGAKIVKKSTDLSLTDLLRKFFEFLAGRRDAPARGLSVAQAKEFPVSDAVFVEDPAEFHATKKRVNVAEQVGQAQWQRVLDEARKAAHSLTVRPLHWFHWSEVFDPRDTPAEKGPRLQTLEDALVSRQEGAGLLGKHGEAYGGKQGKGWSETGKKGGEPASAGTSQGDAASSAKGGKEIAGDWWAKGTGKGSARFSPYAKGSGKAGK